jgi:FkbM family methyltransferase
MSIRSLVRDGLRSSLRRLGYDVVRYSPDRMGRVVSLLGRVRSQVVLDVGANRGQYRTLLRNAGFDRQIISFEPNPAAYAELAANASGDRRWRGLAVGLGREDGSASLRIGANSEFSSFLQARSGAEEIDGGITSVGEVRVPVRTLTSLWSELDLEGTRPFLKLDVQGFERDVLAGTAERLHELAGIQLELPFEPLYEGQPPLGEVVPELLAEGFAVYALLEGARDQRTGALVEADVVLFNRELLYPALPMPQEAESGGGAR